MTKASHLSKKKKQGEFGTEFQQAAETMPVAEQTNDQTVLDAAIAAWDRVISHPDFANVGALVQTVSLNSAGAALYHRNLVFGQIDDLNRAVTLYQQAVQLVLQAPPDPNLPALSKFFDDLGVALHHRYKLTKTPKDLDEAVAMFRQAVEHAQPESPDFARYLHNKGIALRDRFQSGSFWLPGELDYLKEAIEAFQNAANLITEDRQIKAKYLNDLGQVVYILFTVSNREEDLQSAIKINELASQIALPNSADLKGYLSNLSITLRTAVQLVQKQGRDPTAYQSLLGKCLIDLYECTSNFDLINEAVSVLEEAVKQTPAGSTDLASRQNDLGKSLRRRATARRDIGDLAESIAILRQAAQNVSASVIDPLSILNALASSLDVRYDWIGDEQDLTEILEILSKVVKNTPENDISLPIRLNNLGVAIRKLYFRLGKVEDLDEAISLFRKAKDKASLDEQSLPSSLTNLGRSLADRYELTQDTANLEEGINVLKDAIDQTRPGSPSHPLQLISLAEILRHRDQIPTIGNRKDLEEAIRFAQQAVNEISRQSLYLPHCLNVLGNCLSDQYAYTKNAADLDATVEAYQKAVEIESEYQKSPSLPVYLNNLGTCLMDRYQKNRQEEDFAMAQASFRHACQLGLEQIPEEAIRSAGNWCRWAFIFHAWDAVIEAYRFSEQSINLLMVRQLQREEKESWLNKVQGLSNCAAYALAKLDRRSEAIELLEAGRAVLLAEALEQSRRDLERLPDLGYKDIYDRYLLASQSMNGLQKAAHQPQNPDLSQEGYLILRQKQENAQKELAAAIEVIRGISGYADFLNLKPNFERIQENVPDNAILVYLTSTPTGGLALIVHGKKDQEVESIWLDQLTDTTIRARLMGAPEEAGSAGYLKVYYWRNNPNSTLDKDTWLADIYNTGDWLWVTLIGPLIERLNPTSKGVLSGDQERPSRQRELPHIIFVPTGLIGLLPLHLAFRIEDGKQRTILDDFIISYTPSAHSLGTARSRAAEGERQYPRLLALVDPSGNLPSSLIEAQLIASHFPDGMAQIIEGKQATQEALVNALPGQTYLHFACHGRYDPIDVLHSSLMLAQDNPLELREILEPGFNLASTRLVTLSACETGLIEISKIPDECVGLPAGFLQAGAPAVVSTLWAVNDLSTSLLMGEFYRRHLVEGEAIAEALCGAQLWLRDSTAGELRLADYFEQLSTSSRPPDPEAFSSMRYYQKHPDDKPFNAPYYWAPFILTGW